MTETTMTGPTIRNGVNVDDLLGAIAAVTADGANGRLRFRVDTKWLGGFRARHTPGAFSVGGQESRHAADYSVVSDEPAEVLGTDDGISPAELMLSALGACLTVGYAANAAALGIDIEDLAIEISTDASLEGFMNIRDAEPAVESVTVHVNVKTSAPAEAVQELHAYVNAHSPIWQTLACPVRLVSSVSVSRT
jgi:uncharacterized OsmC-like protein